MDDLPDLDRPPDELALDRTLPQSDPLLRPGTIIRVLGFKRVVQLIKTQTSGARQDEGR